VTARSLGPSARSDAAVAAANDSAVAARSAAVAVGILTIVAVALRVPELGSRSLWLDEAWRANLALAPTWQAFWSDVLGGSHIEAPMPPLYALLLRAVALACGRSAACLRASSLVASVAAVPLAFAVGRRVYGRVAGVAAAACFACYPAAVTFGRELKPYALDVAVVLLLLLLAADVVRRRDGGSWMRFALAAALAPGLSYPAVLVVPGVGLGLVVACGDRRDVVRWAAALGVAGAAALAWYALVIAAQRARPVNTEYWAATFPSLDRAGAGMVAAAATELVAFTLGVSRWLALPGLAIGWLRAPRWFVLAGLGALATVVAAGFAGVYPLSGGRTSLFLLPFVYLPFSATAAWLITARRPFLRPSSKGEESSAGAGERARSGDGEARALARTARITAAIALLSLPLLAPADPNAGLVYEETAPLVATLAAERKPDERVYVYYGAVPAFTFYHPDLDAGITLGGSHRDDVLAYETELKPLVVAGTRLWVLFAHVFPRPDGGDERAAILSTLALYGKPVGEWKTPGASLHVLELARGADRVRHIEIRPEDAANPERLRELLRK